MDGRSQDDIDEECRAVLGREPVLRVPLSRAHAEIVSRGSWTSDRARARCPDGGHYPRDTEWKGFLRAEAVAAVLNVGTGELPDVALPATAMRALVRFVSESVSRDMRPYPSQPAWDAARDSVFVQLVNAADRTCRDYAAAGGRFTEGPVPAEAPAPRR